MDPSKPKKHRFNLPLSGFSDEQLRRLQTIIVFAGFDTTLITADGSRLMFSDEYARDGYLRKAVIQYRGGKHTLRYETPYVVRDPRGGVYVVGRIRGLEVFRIGVVTLFSSRVSTEFPN